MMQIVEQIADARLVTRVRQGARLFVRRSIGLLPQLSRYTVVSIAALAADFGAYIALFSAGVKASLAGVAGYAIGMTIHYILSSRFVFDMSRSHKSEQRLFVEFLFSGLVGITLTGFIIAMGTQAFGMAPISAKIIAVMFSFAAVFAIRRSFVFAN